MNRPAEAGLTAKVSRLDYGPGVGADKENFEWLQPPKVWVRCVSDAGGRRWPAIGNGCAMGVGCQEMVAPLATLYNGIDEFRRDPSIGGRIRRVCLEKLRYVGRLPREASKEKDRENDATNSAASIEGSAYANRFRVSARV